MRQTSSLISKCVFDTFMNIVEKLQNDTGIKERLQQETKDVDSGLFDNYLILAGVGGTFLFFGLLIYIYTKSNEKGDGE
jgi:hypothetical protein